MIHHRRRDRQAGGDVSSRPGTVRCGTNSSPSGASGTIPVATGTVRPVSRWPATSSSVYPRAVAQIAAGNKAVLYGLFFGAGAGTLRSIAAGNSPPRCRGEEHDFTPAARRSILSVRCSGRSRWSGGSGKEIHHRAGAGAWIRAIARELELDRRQGASWLGQSQWKPYQSAACSTTADPSGWTSRSHPWDSAYSGLHDRHRPAAAFRVRATRRCSRSELAAGTIPEARLL